MYADQQSRARRWTGSKLDRDTVLPRYEDVHQPRQTNLQSGRSGSEQSEKPDK